MAQQPYAVAPRKAVNQKVFNGGQFGSPVRLLETPAGDRRRAEIALPEKRRTNQQTQRVRAIHRLSGGQWHRQQATVFAPGTRITLARTLFQPASVKHTDVSPAISNYSR